MDSMGEMAARCQQNSFRFLNTLYNPGGTRSPTYRAVVHRAAAGS
jgi:hypothetical protein